MRKVLFGLLLLFAPPAYSEEPPTPNPAPSSTPKPKKFTDEMTKKVQKGAPRQIEVKQDKYDGSLDVQQREFLSPSEDDVGKGDGRGLILIYSRAKDGTESYAAAFTLLTPKMAGLRDCDSATPPGIKCERVHGGYENGRFQENLNAVITRDQLEAMAKEGLDVRLNGDRRNVIFLADPESASEFLAKVDEVKKGEK